MTTLLKSGNPDALIGAVSAALERSDEAPFWAQKTIPYVQAISSVLFPLRDQNLLFDPEGKKHETLTPALFLRWCDLMSLKTLAFTLAKSNEQGKLIRVKIPSETYTPIDLEILGTYLSGYTVNLVDESQDFPITNYNLHIGITTLIEKILNADSTNV
ncbi:MAG TPA: hypothetical protein VFX66_01755 [Sulfuricurvum sp.]|nr:hypothetical protein [Sulfuricurvum sp.]